MQKFMRWLGWYAKAITAALRPIYTEVVTSSGASPTGEMTGPVRITLLGLIYTTLVGAIDLATTKGMNFDLFYLLGCAVVGWAAGARAAVLTTLASGAFLFLDSAQLKGGSLPAWVLNWNFIMRLLGLAAAGRLAAEAGRLTRNLERTVLERTSRLQSEAELHKETAVQLRDTLELFRQVTENITEVFWVTDPAKSRVNYVSRGFERVWGQPRQTIYAAPSTWLEAVHDEDRLRVTEATFTRQIRGDYDEVYRVRRPDGSLCWVHDRAFPVRNEKAEVYRIVGITEDVTERKRAEQLLQAQRDVGVTLSQTSELGAALEQLLETVTRLEGIDCGGVYLLNRQTGALELEAHLGLPPGLVERVLRYEADTAEASLVKTGRTRYGLCGAGRGSSRGTWSGDNLRALAVIPLQHKGEVLGALNLASRAQDEIPAQTRVVLETIAAQAAGAIARIRLEREILEISDLEQARIGQDIHDGLCQQLIGMAFSANSLQQSLAAQVRPEAATARKICGLLDEAITESRRVCRGLYPVRLNTEGLVPALEELARITGERYDLSCRCEADSRRVQCPLTTATHLYRIAQEAVNNAVKHSGGRNVRIRLAESGAGIELTVQDDGQGIKAAAERHAGMGLHIMDYRARSIGGSLRIQGDDTGTMISCVVPARGCT